MKSVVIFSKFLLILAVTVLMLVFEPRRRIECAFCANAMPESLNLIVLPSGTSNFSDPLGAPLSVPLKGSRRFKHGGVLFRSKASWCSEERHREKEKEMNPDPMPFMTSNFK